MKDRIEITYEAIDEILANHGKPRPSKFGGGYWDSDEEFEIYKKQVGDRYTKLQWDIIESYFREKSRTIPKE